MILFKCGLEESGENRRNAGTGSSQARYPSRDLVSSRNMFAEWRHKLPEKSQIMELKLMRHTSKKEAYRRLVITKSLTQNVTHTTTGIDFCALKEK